MAGKAYENQVANVRPYIVALIAQQGRDFSTCELCGGHIPAGKFVVHHTRYEGATFQDLRIACQSCDKQPENRLLG